MSGFIDISFDDNTRHTQVEVAGDFNQWSLTPLQNEEGTKYTALISELTPGVKYNYKFKVDGQWALQTSHEVQKDKNGESVHSATAVLYSELNDGNHSLPRDKSTDFSTDDEFASAVEGDDNDYYLALQQIARDNTLNTDLTNPAHPAADYASDSDNATINHSTISNSGDVTIGNGESIDRAHIPAVPEVPAVPAVPAGESVREAVATPVSQSAEAVPSHIPASEPAQTISESVAADLPPVPTVPAVSEGKHKASSIYDSDYNEDEHPALPQSTTTSHTPVVESSSSTDNTQTQNLTQSALVAVTDAAIAATAANAANTVHAPTQSEPVDNSQPNNTNTAEPKHAAAQIGQKKETQVVKKTQKPKKAKSKNPFKRMIKKLFGKS